MFYNYLIFNMVTLSLRILLKYCVSINEIPQFETGQLVRVVEGAFTGVVGRVARYQGQQRVAVIVDNLMTVCTAYIPSAFLTPL